ncbi:MAG: relaxase/mobilization nuclease domain-containing protein [Ruminococcus sp.]|nr:relaxase/mobilization nuclease domain-containing protein [Ruminococcus sp.]
MATTGFWPVRVRLKDVLNYAENPDKTTAKQYLDEDLQNALKYAENSDKTDKQMFVSGINCSKNGAYEEMCAVKKRYGERGKVIAYHGYQSFQAGEVTPEEAHRIGVETARRMWGDRFQVVVTTHLNTQNLHNHFILNSLSFKDGKKYRNKIGDHMELRRVSDEVCCEHGKSVLENAPFYGGDKAYWTRKNGQLPHKDMLRKDVDEALANTCTPVDFEIYLRSLGYQFVRNFKYEHPSVIAPDWQKPVRISSLGKDYSRQAILTQLSTQHEDRYFMDFYTPRPVVRRTPLILVIRDYEKEHTPDLITSLFELIIAIAKICTGSNIQKADYRPLSPDLRAEIINLDRTLEEYHFLCDQFINCAQDFVECRAEIVGKIESFEAERQHIRNQIRRAKTPEEDYSLKEKCREITKKLTPLRKQLKICERIENKVPRLRALIEQEKQLEQGRYKYKYYQQIKSKQRSYER